jgi:PAS domain S-box-containing protein
MASSALIRVLPPFWQTAWFYSVVLIGVAGVGFFTHRFFSQRRYLRRLKCEVVARVNELQQSESRFGVTLDSIADGVLTTGLDGEVLYMNPAAEQILGQSMEHTRGKKLLEFLATSGCTEKDRNALMTHLFEGTMWTSRLKLEKPDPNSRLVEAGTAPLTSADQKLLGAVVVVRDVTDKVRLQQELDQSQKLASLGTLAGGIAHDFNNVLAVIKWNLSTLRNEAGEASQLQAIELIDDAVAQATNLSEQILTFARGGNPRLQSCCLDTLIRGSIAMFSNEPGLRFELDVVEELWPADVDAVQFKQVLHNLLINASQAMPSGGLICIRASNRSVEAPAERREVEIEIKDQGTGIPQDQLHRVFEPYFTTKANGFGIGLATCYSIIQKHHGKLSVESEIGAGSSFRIRLPASTIPAETPESPPRIDQKMHFDYKRILVVDDDELIRKSLVAILKTMKYQVVTVSSGHEALETYQQEFDDGRRFHAVLIDLTMPGGLDGRETFQGLQLIDPEVRGIAISGYSDDQVLENYREYGFVARLQKPCSLQELQHVLIDPAIYSLPNREFSHPSK